MVNPAGQQLGNYRLVSLLGHGGFADVYLGEHIFLRTYAAVKVLHEARMMPQAVQRFIKEAQTIARLKHPNIVRVWDFGLERNTLFLVMDYVPYGTLHQRHPDGSVLSLATVLCYVQQVAAALDYAHQNKLVHRDIKPENMLVGANNTILLSDFGLAITAHRPQSLSLQERFGTLHYVAPEHIEGKAVPASDQYSLGIVVYKWLCGRYPFDDASEIAIARKHLYAQPPPLRGMLPSLSPQVEAVVLRALAKDPNQRFASVQDFANALEDACQQRQLENPSSATCSRCRQPRLPSQIPCPSCHLHASTRSVSSPVNRSTFLTNRTAPPSPFIVPLPTEEQMHRAMVSPTNPYAPWGKLILDGTESNPFTQRIGFFLQLKRLARQFAHHKCCWEQDHVVSYIGEECALINSRPDSLLCAMMENITLRDFAFQIEITPASHQALPGVVFRADRKGRQGHVYCVSVFTYEESMAKVKYFLELIEGKSRRPLAEGNFTLDQQRKPSYLLGIVAQGPRIDLYLNLNHVIHLDDCTYKQGAIGIVLYRPPLPVGGEATLRWQGSSRGVQMMTAKFSRAKLWIP